MGAQAADLVVLIALVAGSLVATPRMRRICRPVVSAAARAVRRPEPPRPVGRPIEAIARDAQRLGMRFRCVPAGVSFARFEARRLAYDEVLGEACRALGVDNLLRVLPPGTELDIERLRVEAVLERVGLRLDGVA